jgi:hypothetical protein
MLKGVQFITDDAGKKMAVVLSLAEWGKFWEDIYDVLISESRRDELAVSWEELKTNIGQSHRNLWPENFGTIGKAVAPITILREQAAFLGEKTQNIVKAEVYSQALPQIPDNIYTTFYLVAPDLDNYRFALFQISHKIEDRYPINLHSETLGIEKEIITTEDELLSTLERIFSHEKTINIINSMLIQSEPNKVLLSFI